MYGIYCTEARGLSAIYDMRLEHTCYNLLIIIVCICTHRVSEVVAQHTAKNMLALQEKDER